LIEPQLWFIISNMPLSSEEIQRRDLVSKLKEEIISYEEAQELVSLKKREAHNIGGRRRRLASVCNIVSYIICQ
jgi:hypothetical protein